MSERYFINYQKLINASHREQATEPCALSGSRERLPQQEYFTLLRQYKEERTNLITGSIGLSPSSLINLRFWCINFKVSVCLCLRTHRQDYVWHTETLFLWYSSLIICLTIASEIIISTKRKLHSISLYWKKNFWIYTCVTWPLWQYTCNSWSLLVLYWD